MPTPHPAPQPSAILAKKIALLAHIAPAEIRGLELLVEDALQRHQEEDRAKRLAMFRRVK